MATLCATLTDTDTSNTVDSGSNTDLDLNIGSCLPVMYCRASVEVMRAADFLSTLLLIYLIKLCFIINFEF